MILELVMNILIVQKQYNYIVIHEVNRTQNIGHINVVVIYNQHSLHLTNTRYKSEL